jgi:hypothetical protein
MENVSYRNVCPSNCYLGEGPLAALKAPLVGNGGLRTTLATSNVQGMHRMQSAVDPASGALLGAAVAGGRLGG